MSLGVFPRRLQIIHVFLAGQPPKDFVVACGGWFRRDVSGRLFSVASLSDHCALPGAMVFVERRLDLRAAGDIRRRSFLLFLVSADGDSWQLGRGSCDGGGCRHGTVLLLSIIRSAPLVEYPRRDVGRELLLSRTDSLARSADRRNSLGGLHVCRRSHI